MAGNYTQASIAARSPSGKQCVSASVSRLLSCLLALSLFFKPRLASSACLLLLAHTLYFATRRENVICFVKQQTCFKSRASCVRRCQEERKRQKLARPARRSAGTRFTDSRIYLYQNVAETASLSSSKIASI